jgi:hypothetical protein
VAQAEGVDFIRPGPGEPGDIQVSDAGEFALRPADRPAGDFHTGKTVLTGEFEDLVEGKLRQYRAEESKLHAQMLEQKNSLLKDFCAIV